MQPMSVKLSSKKLASCDAESSERSAPEWGNAMTTTAVDRFDSIKTVKTDAPIVFFDGVCGFCNFWVDFLLARDRRGRLRFAPLQGETARRMLSPTDVEQLHTLVLWTSHGVYRKSSAIARILILLGGLWTACGGLLWLVPRPLRNWGYDLVAKYRYRIFGKKDACRMPLPDERARFLP
jgi:predicted DCC family thiol-disulfide oxidoreductase YuxK